MAEYPPFMNAYGLLTKILEKIKTARTPDRFTQDFLTTKLGFSGGSAMAFIPFAKRIGLLASDGAPTELYKRFRNQSESKAAMAQAIRTGFAELYERNEYAHELNQEKLAGLIMEVTGLEKGNTTLNAIVRSFMALRQLADMEASLSEKASQKASPPQPAEAPPSTSVDAPKQTQLGLAYMINLVLPKTDDINVFNAIFRSLKDNLLTK